MQALRVVRWFNGFTSEGNSTRNLNALWTTQATDGTREKNQIGLDLSIVYERVSVLFSEKR